MNEEILAILIEEVGFTRAQATAWLDKYRLVNVYATKSTSEKTSFDQEVLTELKNEGKAYTQAKLGLVVQAEAKGYTVDTTKPKILAEQFVWLLNQRIPYPKYDSDGQIIPGEVIVQDPWVSPEMTADERYALYTKVGTFVNNLYTEYWAMFGEERGAPKPDPYFPPEDPMGKQPEQPDVGQPASFAGTKLQPQAFVNHLFLLDGADKSSAAIGGMPPLDLARFISNQLIIGIKEQSEAEKERLKRNQAYWDGVARDVLRAKKEQAEAIMNESQPFLLDAIQNDPRYANLTPEQQSNFAGQLSMQFEEYARRAYAVATGRGMDMPDILTVITGYVEEQQEFGPELAEQAGLRIAEPKAALEAGEAGKIAEIEQVLPPFMPPGSGIGKEFEVPYEETQEILRKLSGDDPAFLRYLQQQVDPTTREGQKLLNQYKQQLRKTKDFYEELPTMQMSLTPKGQTVTSQMTDQELAAWAGAITLTPVMVIDEKTGLATDEIDWMATVTQGQRGLSEQRDPKTKEKIPTSQLWAPEHFSILQRMLAAKGAIQISKGMFGGGMTDPTGTAYTAEEQASLTKSLAAHRKKVQPSWEGFLGSQVGMIEDEFSSLYQKPSRKSPATIVKSPQPFGKGFPGV
jgi:hypothetical protein